MAQDDYFSFGDEELEAELNLTDLGPDPGGNPVALVEPPDGAEEFGADEDWFGSPTEGVERPRGDSKGSLERRLPSSWRTRVLGGLALCLLILFLCRTVISTLGGDEPAVQNSAPTTSRSAPPSAVDLDAGRRAEAIRASRQRAVESQRARQHRALTRRRARRRRQRKAAERHQRANVHRSQAEAQEEPSDTVEVPAPVYTPPTYEPAPPPSSPPPEPAPEPPGEPHIQNGAKSSEFGL
jgi:hypothetical protein